MLRRNVNVADGLVNGATGVVLSFEWLDSKSEKQHSGELPARVWIKFDNPRVGRKQQAGVHTSDDNEHGPVYIVPACSQFSGIGGGATTTLQRVQLPLMLCWAATIHKVQGLTLDRAVISLQHLFSPAQAYVALSRVRTLEGLLISCWGDPTRIAWAHDDVRREYERMRAERMFLLPAIYSLQGQADSKKSIRRPLSRLDYVNKQRRKEKIYTVEAIVGKVS